MFAPPQPKFTFIDRLLKLFGIKKYQVEFNKITIPACTKSYPEIRPEDIVEHMRQYEKQG